MKTKKIHLKKGTLSKYGYHIHHSTKSRRQSLFNAISNSNPITIFKKVNILSIFNKYKNPIYSKRFRKDAKWILKSINKTKKAN
jgi:hypothetical protein